MLLARFSAPPLCLLLLSSCGGLIDSYRDSAGSVTEPGGKALQTGKLVATVTRGTALSAVRRPDLTTRLGLAVLWQRPRELFPGTLPDAGRFTSSDDHSPGSAAFEAELDAAGMPAPVEGKITWLVDGKRFFPEFEREIAAARQSIDVQAYIFDNDDIAVRQADLLKQRSESLKVRVMFDELGSLMSAGKEPGTPVPPDFVPPPNIGDYLRKDSAVEVRTLLNPWLVCDHTKLHVFDSKVALMGCMNLGREYHSEWHDLMFRVEGPAVAELQEDYETTWRRAHPAGLLGLLSRKPRVPEPPAVAGSVPLRILRTDPVAGRYEIHRSMLLAIRSARERIWIEDPYIGHDDLTDALEEAAGRGVDVRLIYPGENDSKIMDIANRTFATDLVEAGGKAYAYPGMTHMKVMICDNWVSVGSANLDTLSMRINRELNLSISDRKTAEELVRLVFLPDFAISKRLTLASPPPASAPLAEAVADQL